MFQYIMEKLIYKNSNFFQPGSVFKPKMHALWLTGIKIEKNDKIICIKNDIKKSIVVFWHINKQCRISYEYKRVKIEFLHRLFEKI